MFALVSVLLASPSSPRKALLRSMRTVYLFHITHEQQGEERVWWVDMVGFRACFRVAGLQELIRLGLDE